MTIEYYDRGDKKWKCITNVTLEDGCTVWQLFSRIGIKVRKLRKEKIGGELDVARRASKNAR